MINLALIAIAGTLLCLNMSQATFYLSEEGFLPLPVTNINGVAALAALGGTLLYALISGRMGALARFRHSLPMLVPFLLLILVVLVTSMHPNNDWGETATKFTFIPIYYFLLFSAVLVLPAPVLQAWRLYVVASLVVLFGSVLYEAANPGIFNDSLNRTAGFTGSPNVTAFIAAMLTAAAVRYDRFHLLDAAIIAVGFITAFMTLSRSGTVMFAVFLLAYLVLIARTMSLTRVVTLAVGTVAVGIAAATFISTTTSSLDIFKTDNAQRRLATLFLEGKATYSTDRHRFDLFDHYIPKINESPIVGHGSSYSQSQPLGPHNMYIAFWVNNGIFGLLGYLGMLVGLMVIFRRRRFMPGMVALGIIMLAGLVSHTIFHNEAVYVVTALMLAATAPVGAMMRRPPAARPPPLMMDSVMAGARQPKAG